MLSLEIGSGGRGAVSRGRAEDLDRLRGVSTGLSLGIDSGFLKREVSLESLRHHHLQQQQQQHLQQQHQHQQQQQQQQQHQQQLLQRQQQQQMMMRQQWPVQLDLLPRVPVCPQQQQVTVAVSHSVSAPPVSSISQITRHSLFGNSIAANDNDEVVAPETHSSSRGASPAHRGIDMNEIPPAETADASGSPHSTISPLPFDIGRKGESSVNIKREREKSDMDVDRACEVSSRGSDEEDGAPRKKLRLSKEQSALLEESFKEHSTLNPKQKNALAKQLNLRPRQVEVWFQNRRARTKLKQTEIDCELLKRCCETLTEENRRLLKEVQELRAIKVPPPCVISQDFYMPLPAATLTMCPSCERVATVDNRSLPFAKQAHPHPSSSSSHHHHTHPHPHHPHTHPHLLTQQPHHHQQQQQQQHQQSPAAAACQS